MDAHAAVSASIALAARHDNQVRFSARGRRA